MKTAIGNGARLSLTANGTITSGSPMLFGDTFVIPYASASSGEVVALETEGEHSLDKVSEAIASTPHVAAEALAAGQRVFWDSVNSVVTGKALGPYIGIVTVAAADSAEKVRVALRPTGLGPTGWTVGFLDATAGLAVGTHAFVGASIPVGCIPLRTVYQVLTTFTSATDAGTIALGYASDGASSLKTAVAISNGANPYDAGYFAAAPNAYAKTTAARAIQAVVAVEALTAGRMVAAVEWARLGTFA